MTLEKLTVIFISIISRTLLLKLDSSNIEKLYMQQMNRSIRILIKEKLTRLTSFKSFIYSYWIDSKTKFYLHFFLWKRRTPNITESIRKFSIATLTTVQMKCSYKKAIWGKVWHLVWSGLYPECFLRSFSKKIVLNGPWDQIELAFEHKTRPA